MIMICYKTQNSSVFIVIRVVFIVCSELYDYKVVELYDLSTAVYYSCMSEPLSARRTAHDTLCYYPPRTCVCVIAYDDER